MMNKTKKTILSGVLGLLLLAVAGPVDAKVTAQEAELLKTTLTPFGAEKAGNADGTIPAWEGGYTTPIPGFVNGGRRPDPFKEDKVLFSIDAKNMDQYADQLTEASKALLKKYPDTYRIDVYPTRRTAIAPQWVYDNTLANATRAYTEGDDIKGAYGGIPFPIPKTGLEVMWNHLLRWRPSAWHFTTDALLGTSSGKLVVLNKVEADQMMPYYLKDQNLEGYEKDWNGEFWMLRLATLGPPLRAGEGIVGRENLEGKKTKSWVYLTGQRRVRQLPVSCCDTPTPALAGITYFDETECFTGSEALQRFDFKIVGKKEMYIPYNCNKNLEPKDIYEAVLPRHLNPDYVRWELHRVWVIEATLRDGKRHSCVLNQYYIDEDTWTCVLSDRYDANGDLWRAGYSLPVVMPDVPAVVGLSWGFYDLKANTWAASNLYNAYDEQHKVMPPYKNIVFTPSALQSQGIR
jgi:hypothetical protein